MTFKEYQEGALNTWRHDQTYVDQIVNASLGLGEVGEVQNIIKKVFFHNKQDSLWHEKVADELGDVLYYIAILANKIGLSLEEIAELNNEKLSSRYPDGFKDGGGIR